MSLSPVSFLRPFLGLPTFLRETTTTTTGVVAAEEEEEVERWKGGQCEIVYKFMCSHERRSIAA